MKPASLLIPLLLIWTACTAQNPLFLSFEHDFGEVKDYLENNHQPGWEIAAEQDELLHLAFFGGNTFYHFHDGILYEVSMVKRYTSKREVREARQGVLEYFERIKAMSLDHYQMDNKFYHYSAVKGRIYELVMQSLDHNEWELAFSSRKVDQTPKTERGYYDYPNLRFKFKI